MIERLQFRAAMSRLGAAVNIITTNGPAGLHGMTASAVCSVSDDPASVLVCINRGSRMHAVVEKNGVLCVNVLGSEHQELSGLFAGRSPVEERFAGGSWDVLARGVPALTDALCNFSCRISATYDAGSHSVFMCHVEELRMREDGEGLVYFSRAYHRLPQVAA